MEIQKNKNLNNLVVKSHYPEDGKKIVQWFKDKGVDVGKKFGLNSKVAGDNYYYGNINGLFNCYDYKYFKDNSVPVLVLSVEDMYKYNIYPKQMLVSDWTRTDEKAGETIPYNETIPYLERNVIGEFNYNDRTYYISEIPNSTTLATWKYAVDINEPKKSVITELSIQEIADKFGLKPEELRIKY